MMTWMFELRGPVPKKFKNILILVGVGIIFLVWMVLSSGSKPIIPSFALPHPSRVFNAFGDLYRDNDLLKNTTLSIALNLGGYIKAILWGIPIGFIIGLFPVKRGSFQYIIDSIRFLPLTAVTSLFLLWYGIGSEMKINFLAFGIFIYLLPTVVNRIDEVGEVYLRTVHTLGASKWQTIKTVFFPAVMSKLIDDIRVLTAISWTYIIVAETTASEGGLGPLTFAAQRQARVDKIFAILLLIIFIGVVQDRVFAYLDKKFFPHKYQTKTSYEQQKLLKPIGPFDAMLTFAMQIFGYILLAAYVLLVLDEYLGLLGNLNLFTYFFADRAWTVHFIILSYLAYLSYQVYQKYINK
ncbi:MAG TPA: ABC transporter permease subunit [Saprospiraceae bacterium]|nr:ABC transporter permease subunit [Saprospiraceae bacterium]